MLLLVCVLEPLPLTGLELHEWLGLALCPLVLLHVVLQWQWFVTQFRRMLVRGAYRARVNAALNIGLLVMMAAVLFSGVIISKQVAPLVGESLGRSRIWSGVHGWFNLIVVVLVGLHLALNWDWLLAAMRRRAGERPALAGTPIGTAAVPAFRYTVIRNSLGRGIVVFAVSLLAAFAVYLALAPLEKSGPDRPPRQTERAATSQVAGASAGKIPRRERPASLPGGLRKLIVTVAVMFFAAVVGRFVLRIHL